MTSISHNYDVIYLADHLDDVDDALIQADADASCFKLKARSLIAYNVHRHAHQQH